MNRTDILKKLAVKSDNWDFIVIGGGATGAGVAIEAATRGYGVLLLEQHDFGKGTSSRSTKLIHGGVRYLQQGNISLVLEALHERGLLLANAPHLVHKLGFIVPAYHWWQLPFYATGLKIYDLLAGRYRFGRSKILSKSQTMAHLPTIEQKNLKGGILYFDGQFDDARLIINMIQTAQEHGAEALNYVPVTKLIVQNNLVRGVLAHDVETGKEYEIRSKVVINATGVFADSVCEMSEPGCTPMIRPSQGIHLVLDKSFLPGDFAMMIPKTDDGRVLFAIPWDNYALIGTTDTPVESIDLEPRPIEAEVDFLLQHAARYLMKKPVEKDVLSIFAGLRPLVKSTKEKSTKSISREHSLLLSQTGLVTITGGKWTTCRKMGEDTINFAEKSFGYRSRASVTHKLKIHGSADNPVDYHELSIYGTDADSLRRLIESKPEYSQKLHDDLPIIAGEVVWAVRYEMARTVEDFLARRRRVLFQDARKSILMAKKVAEIMAQELGQDSNWMIEQEREFTTLAQNYIYG